MGLVDRWIRSDQFRIPNKGIREFSKNNIFVYYNVSEILPKIYEP